MKQRIWTAFMLLATFVVALPVMGAEGQGGEETISLFGGTFGQAFWTLLIFVLVVLTLGKFAWGPLLATLQKREAFIRDSLASAKQDREDAEKRLNELEARLDKAREEASAIVEEGRRDSEEVKRRIEAEARQSADDTVERAKREIGIARDTALKSLHEEAAGLAMNMASSVLKRQLSPEDHGQLVQNALRQMRDQSSHTN